MQKSTLSPPKKPFCITLSGLFLDKMISPVFNMGQWTCWMCLQTKCCYCNPVVISSWIRPNQWLLYSEINEETVTTFPWFHLVASVIHISTKIVSHCQFLIAWLFSEKASNILGDTYPIHSNVLRCPKLNFIRNQARNGRKMIYSSDTLPARNYVNNVSQKRIF